MTYREIRRMRVSDVQRQFRYWARFPSVRDMVAAYLGIKDSAARTDAPKTEEDIKRIILNHGVPRG